MSNDSKDPAELLAKFCDDNYEDKWELQQSIDSQHVERYIEKTFLASGGLKNIYQVYDKKLKREVALAELKEDLPEEQSENFIEEVNTTAALRHPNIITVLDFGINEKQLPFFTMELKVGDSLGEIIAKQKRSLNERLEIFLKICDAVAYAHSQDILHLDLKPENIQVGEYGEVQLCDWGLSQKIGPSLVTRKIHGTPGFMAPEQLKEGELLDKRTDLFALGAILYSIVTEKRPIAGGINTVIDSTEKGKFPTPNERFPELKVSQSLEAVIQKAMSSKPHERYESVEEFQAEISQYLRGYSTNAQQAGFLTELSLFISRNKQVCFISLCAILTFISIAGFSFVEIQKSKSSTERALEELKQAHTTLQQAQQQERELNKQKAEAQRLYFKEKIKKEKMYSQLLDKELKVASDLMIAPRFYNDPQKAAKESLAILKHQLGKSKDQKEIAGLIVLNLFISQQFSEIEQYTNHRYPILNQLARKYKDKPRTKFGILNDKDFISLMADLVEITEKDNPLKKICMERAICYMISVRQPIFISSELIKLLLLSWNPQWDASGLDYNKATLTLKLRGKKLKLLKGTSTYSSGLSFLRFLKIDRLDIRHTGIEFLDHIRGTNINKLDIRHTKVTHLHPHGATKNIKEVYLTQNQFKPQDQRQIPLKVKLVFLKPE